MFVRFDLTQKASLIQFYSFTSLIPLNSSAFYKNLKMENMKRSKVMNARLFKYVTQGIKHN